MAFLGVIIVLEVIAFGFGFGMLMFDGSDIKGFLYGFAAVNVVGWLVIVTFAGMALIIGG